MHASIFQLLTVVLSTKTVVAELTVNYTRDTLMDFPSSSSSPKEKAATATDIVDHNLRGRHPRTTNRLGSVNRWLVPEAPTTNSTALSSPCTAELLMKDADRPSYGVSIENGTWRWRVSKEVQESCRLDKPHLTPLESTPDDIQAALDRKWILIIGDSSVRMLHRYLIGRWLDDWTHWPSDPPEHGPNVRKAGLHLGCDNADTGADTPCHIDVYHKGVRVTFVWMALHFTHTLERLLSRTVGAPDVVVGEHGYWERFTLKNTKNIKGQKQRIYRSLKNAKRIPHQVTNVLSRHTSEGQYRHPRAYASAGEMRKIWMTLFGREYFEHFGLVNDTSLFKSTAVAQRLGWEVFDRSKLVPRELVKGDNPIGPHPKNEVLEFELELLLLLIRNTAQH